MLQKNLPRQRNFNLKKDRKIIKSKIDREKKMKI